MKVALCQQCGPPKVLQIHDVGYAGQTNFVDLTSIIPKM